MSRDGTDTTTARAWQACVTCRRKKIKCDGNNPCHNCGSRDLVCDYPGSNDNASNSRNYAAMYETRFKQLEELCQNLQAVTTKLTQAIEKLPQGRGTVMCSQHTGCTPLECISQNLHNNVATVGSLSASETLESACNLSVEHNSQSHAPDSTEQPDDDYSGDFVGKNHHDDPSTSAFGSLVHDSYGSLRFIGGASNEFLVQSAQSVSICQDIETSPFSVRSHANSTQGGKPKLELPFFVQGYRWRDLPFLPKPADFNLPPKYIADMLVGLYFEHYHYTFPVLYKPYFLRDYNRLYTANRGEIRDAGFLSIFFAVCACASSLTAPEGNHSSFPGLEFHEKALLLHYSSTGQATKARTQCLALISMCCAGWNTVSTSWHFAGQAVRAAQELGMHLSEVTYDSNNPASDPAALIEVESSRRIWWSIYCLDRVTSIYLGRPMAANDNDSRCTLPLALGDEELESYYSEGGTIDRQSISTLPLSGFLTFTHLCRISGRVQSLQAPSEIRDLGTKAGQKRVMDMALDQERSLDEWFKDLPDNLRPLERSVGGRNNSEMFVQGLMIHGGTLVALYRTFVSRKHSFSQRQTIENCVTAARSCISYSGLIRDSVPPSHYLALCVHYLTISGLVLLRMTNPANVRDDADLQQCIRALEDLEVTWSGATRGKVIIEQILKTFQDNRESETLNLDFQTLLQNPELDLTGLELPEGFFENVWGTFG